MKYPTVFDLIADVFRKADIVCILIGGFAVNYYKVTRQTADIDFLISKEDFGKIKILLEKEGYQPKWSQDNFIQLENNVNNLMDIDFMFVDQDTFNKIKVAGNEIKIAGRNFIIPSLMHLIALKLHSIKNNPKREITDLPDIARLIENNNIDVNNSEFKELCLKYGTKDIYGKLEKYR